VRSDRLESSPTSTDAQPAGRYVLRVAPGVLAAIVQRAAERVPGVVRLADVGSRATQRRVVRDAASSYTRGGLQLAVHDGRVRITLNLVIGRSQNLQRVGAAVQAAVSQAVEQLVGMPVEQVDVYVQDVE
jgi:uncharacterized alkaline shock family protein YloU